MSFSIGIVGLPNAGKSTLFKALTKKEVKIAPRPFTTILPNYGQVVVPDEKLEKIAEVIRPEKITPTTIEFVDIAGLIKDAHKGEGLGNQFLSNIRNCDAIIQVVRAFKDPKVEHVAGSIDPERDMETVKIELLMKDLETIEKATEKLKKELGDKKSQKKLELLLRIKEDILREKLVSDINLTEEERTEIKDFRFLTEKPTAFVFNVGNHESLNSFIPYNSKSPGPKTGNEGNFKYDKEKPGPSGQGYTGFTKNLPRQSTCLNLKLEEEISELSEPERKELALKSNLDKLILSCYNVLNLITFYTVAKGKETKAWTLKKGLTAPKAGGVVHSDFERRFIRALVIPWEKLAETGSWINAKEKGWLQTIGKDYKVQDGDIIEFRI